MQTTVNMALASVASLAAAPALVLPVPLKAHLALATSNTEHGHMQPRGGSGGGCSVAFVWAREQSDWGLAPHRPIKHQAQMAQLGASHLAMAVQVKLNVG